MHLRRIGPFVTAALVIAVTVGFAGTATTHSWTRYATPVERQDRAQKSTAARQADRYMTAVYDRVVAEREATEAAAAAQAELDRQAAEAQAARAAQDAENAENARQAAVRAAVPAPAVVVAPAATVPPSGQCYGAFDCFRACTLPIESGGNYATNTGNGYYGAWQFAAGTWVNAVTVAGHPEWAGVTADQAPPAIQDAAAAWLYSQSGNGPWGGRC